MPKEQGPQAATYSTVTPPGLTAVAMVIIPPPVF